MERLSLFIRFSFILNTNIQPKPRKVLFIAWDSDQSNYLETLFFPIFERLQQAKIAEFLVIQFSWSSQVEINRISALASEKKLDYIHFPVLKKLPSALGAVLTLITKKNRVLSLIRSKNIEIVMPRSTMPAFLTLLLTSNLRKIGVKVIFDADGLPIQERVDFANLDPNSLIYKLLRRVEKEALQNSDRIITRSNASILWHLKKMPSLSPDKFFKVINGRDTTKFNFDPLKRVRIRRQLNLTENELLLVHSGSLGKAYDLSPVFRIMEKSERIKLLLLTRNEKLAKSTLPKKLHRQTFIISTSFDEIPDYLSASDIGVCIRTKAPSLIGLAPIKLGEYLLSGLKCWISPQIGDVFQELKDQPCIYFESEGSDQDCLDWIQDDSIKYRENARELGLLHYDLEKAVFAYQKVFQSL